MYRKEKNCKENKKSIIQVLKHSQQPIFEEEESQPSISNYLYPHLKIQENSNEISQQCAQVNNNKQKNQLSPQILGSSSSKVLKANKKVLCQKKTNQITGVQPKLHQNKQQSCNNITQRSVTYIQLVARRILLKNRILQKKKTYYYKKIKYRGVKMTVVQKRIGKDALILKKKSPICKLEKINQSVFVNKIDPNYQQSGVKILNDTPDKCRCLKSQCRKQYCECYQSKRACGQQCQCVGCLNKNDHKQKTINVNFLNSLGCSCQKNQCSTSYCRCRKFNINCSEKCGCSDKCQN